MTENNIQGDILIVEDDINLRTVLKMQLERAQYAVRAAEDGEAGLKLISEKIPDLVLLDVMMPGMDGWEVCRIIKSDLATANVPVIMLTARNEAVDRVRGLDGGANDYLTKPYEVDELLARVRNILQWSKLQRAANPLTGLPGNITIDSEVQRRIAQEEPFSFLYVDIDNFKAFNDYYSFQKGDEAIRITASILTSTVSLEGSAGDFVGHIGGDDFVLVLNPETAQAVVDEIIHEFDRKIPKLYDSVDRDRGHIESKDRQGAVKKFGVMSITVAVVRNHNQNFAHIGELSQAAAELKSFGKKETGSVVVWDRRAA
jgi:diguanylate cyclase (GGDEF)-like protein